MTKGSDRLLAHAFGERYELPIPLWLFVGGGALVVALSFLVALRRDHRPATTAEAPDLVPLAAGAPIRGVLAVLFTLFVAVVGMVGTQEKTFNVAPLFFWVAFWIAVPLSCGVLGDWTRTVNPFAVAARAGDHPRLRRAVLARQRPLPWTMGWWPAFGLFVLVVLGELVFQLDTTQPSFVGTVLVLYLLASFVLGLLFGPGWRAQGEVFSALFNAWGRLGWFRFGAPGRRGFAGGLDVPFLVAPGRLVFVLLLLVSINFDGLIATPAWVDYERRVLGVGSTTDRLLLVSSLLGLLLVACALFTGFAALSARLGRWRLRPLASLAVLLPSLVPIAFGYLVAHYLEYLITNGQLVGALVTNPGFGDGNTGFVVNPTPLPSSLYWYVSVAMIVAVHVVAVVLAHRQVVARAPDERRALLSELPWLVAMVGYTAFSLYLIAQPLTVSA